MDIVLFGIQQKGKTVVLEVIDNVPYLPLSKSTPCAAAPAASGEDTPGQALEAEVDEVYEVLDTGKRDLKA